MAYFSLALVDGIMRSRAVSGQLVRGVARGVACSEWFLSF